MCMNLSLLNTVVKKSMWLILELSILWGKNWEAHCSVYNFYIFKLYCLILKSARNLNLQSGDVLVYVANEYSQGKANLKQACDTLIQRGIIILPVFVGTNVAVNELALLAESQKTGILKLWEFGN